MVVEMLVPEGCGAECFNLFRNLLVYRHTLELRSVAKDQSAGCCINHYGCHESCGLKISIGSAAAVYRFSGAAVSAIDLTSDKFEALCLCSIRVAKTLHMLLAICREMKPLKKRKLRAWPAA